MTDKATRFGSGSSLIGVLSRPSQEHDVTQRPGVIMLNSGILHRVGACRLYVKTARKLAERGYLCLRFDHAGLGDSGARKGTLSFEEGAAIEVRDAMDHMTKISGVKRFVLLGLCSGADMAYLVGCEDPRVVGLVQLDPYGYKTWKAKLSYVFNHYRKRVFRLDVWKRFFVRTFKRLFQKTEEASDAEPDWYAAPEYIRKIPPREQISQGLQAMISRGVSLLTIFSGGEPNLYNYRNQYRESFSEIDFKGRLQVEHIESATHIFTDLEHQVFVVDTIDKWFGQWFPEQEKSQNEKVKQAANEL